MINETDRIDVVNPGGASTAAIAGGWLEHLMWKKHPTAPALFFLLAVILTMSFSTTALARPELVVGDRAETTINLTSDEETTGAVLNKQEESPVKQRDEAGSSTLSPAEKPSIKPESGRNGKYLIAPYSEPGESAEPKGLLARIFGTIVSVIKYIFYFAIVLVAGFLAIYGVKLFTTKYNTITGGHELINILEVRYLAPGKAVCLIETAGKVLVVGLAGNNINPIAEIDDLEQLESLKRIAADKPAPLQPFQAYLDKFTNRFAKAPQATQAKTRRPVKREREAQVTADKDSHWRDDLRSTGENINKILEEIKKQDGKRSGRPSSTTDKGRGEKGR